LSEKGASTAGRARIGVSSCLLGEKVRYDGGHKLDRIVTDILGGSCTLVPVCPEVGCGLPVPREPMRLEGDPAEPRLVTIASRVDLTERMRSWCRKAAGELEQEGIAGFILKCRSPSCGLQVAVYREDTPVGSGRGIFAAAVTEYFPHLPVEDEERLAVREVREHFIERVRARDAEEETS
jgi:uncharacterized protein YbbK (DUF523 family)